MKTKQIKYSVRIDGYYILSSHFDKASAIRSRDKFLAQYPNRLAVIFRTNSK